MDKKGKDVRTGRSLSWAEREEMIREYLTGKYSKQQLWERYTGQRKEHGQLLDWMRTLGHLSDRPPRRDCEKVVYLDRQAQTTLAKEGNDKSTEELERRIRELEQQLLRAELKAEGYELMIEIAEKELKIPIRKKSGTK
jgi:transposase